jgi:hypothetical protein
VQWDNLAAAGEVSDGIQADDDERGVSGLSGDVKADGHEVLFPPGAKFEVLGVVEPDKTANPDDWGKDDKFRPMVIIMREVD